MPKVKGERMISIIVPIYNVENYILDCFMSLINQTYKDIEIICVDDCTKDNSISIVKEICKIDKRVRIINNEDNRGLGGARNQGIDNALGEYIMFIDSDDYVEHNMLYEMYGAMKENNVDAVICGVTMKGYDWSNTHTAFHYECMAKEKKYNISNNKTILTDMWPSAWNKLFKMSIIRENNIRFKEKLLYEDHTFFYEYFSRCNSFYYLKRYLYNYRQQRPNSITTQSFGREKEIYIVLDYIKNIFEYMYEDDMSEKLFLKVAVRLLDERRYVFSRLDRGYYNYCRSVSNYFKKVIDADIERIRLSKDSFINNKNIIFSSVFLISLKEEIIVIKSIINRQKQKIKKVKESLSRIYSS